MLGYIATIFMLSLVITDPKETKHKTITGD